MQPHVLAGKETGRAAGKQHDDGECSSTLTDAAEAFQLGSASDLTLKRRHPSDCKHHGLLMTCIAEHQQPTWFKRERTCLSRRRAGGSQKWSTSPKGTSYSRRTARAVLGTCHRLEILIMGCGRACRCSTQHIIHLQQLDFDVAELPIQIRKHTSPEQCCTIVDVAHLSICTSCASAQSAKLGGRCSIARQQVQQRLPALPGVGLDQVQAGVVEWL